MFEGNMPEAQQAQGIDPDPARSDRLRVMTWSDLRARLEAGRDLRVAMATEQHDRLASFDVHCARRIAARADEKEGVNPEDSAKGKGHGFNDGSTSHDDDAVGSDPGK